MQARGRSGSSHLASLPVQAYVVGSSSIVTPTAGAVVERCICSLRLRHNRTLGGTGTYGNALASNGGRWRRPGPSR